MLCSAFKRWVQSGPLAFCSSLPVSTLYSLPVLFSFVLNKQTAIPGLILPFTSLKRCRTRMWRRQRRLEGSCLGCCLSPKSIKVHRSQMWSRVHTQWFPIVKPIASPFIFPNWILRIGCLVEQEEGIFKRSEHIDCGCNGNQQHGWCLSGRLAWLCKESPLNSCKTSV